MSSSASLSCLGRPFAFLGDLVGESPCGIAEAELASTEAHGVEGVENVGQGVVLGEGGRVARGSLDGDIGNAVKGRLGIYWRHAETMRYHFAGIWLQIPQSVLIIVLHATPDADQVNVLFVLRDRPCRPSRFPRVTQSHVACELWRCNLPIPH
jgi:hypothetical protein